MEGCAFRDMEGQWLINLENFHTVTYIKKKNSKAIDEIN